MEIVGGILTLIALIAAVVAIFASFGLPAQEKFKTEQDRFGSPRRVHDGYESSPFRWPLRALGILLLGVFLALSAVRIIPAGHVGVVKNRGAVSAEEKTPGFNIVTPFVSDIVNVNTQVQGIAFEKRAAASREYQDVFLTGTLNVHVDPTAAAELYQNVGLDYDKKIVVPFYTNIVKEVVPQYGIAEVLPKREEIRKQTVTKLSAKLAPYGIIVDDVALANVDFNEDYNKAIQNKQVQELQVQTERNITAQRQEQAKQAQEAARGEANATIERAKGEAEANRLISQSITQNLLTRQYIDKLAPTIKTMLMPNDGNFLLDVRGLLNEQPAASPTP